MPMRNVAHCVCNMLDDLYLQHTRHDASLEIIVVDDHSEDGSADVARAWAETRGMPIALLRNERRLWSYGSRLRGLAHAAAPFVWNVDADDRIPANADITRPLALAEQLNCDILHCRAVGVRPPSPLHLPLAWTEPVAWQLRGQDIFRVFMEQSYPPATLCNKIFSARLARAIAAGAPDIEVRYFDVKFFGLLSLLHAQSYHACNETIYEYSMRAHRPAELYARQADALMALRHSLGPEVARTAPDQMDAFLAYCQRRLVIQTGHLCIMARTELAHNTGAADQWLNANIYPHLDKKRLFDALGQSLLANGRRIRAIASKLAPFCDLAANKCQPHEIRAKIADMARLELAQVFGDARRASLAKFGMEIACMLDARHGKAANLAAEAEDNWIMPLMLANAELAATITSIMAPGTDITKKAN